MKILTQFLALSLVLGLAGCIKDDYVDDYVMPEVRITNPIDSIQANTTYQFEAVYFNNVGAQTVATTMWTSSDTSLLVIDNTGLAYAKMEGNVTVTASTMQDGEMVSAAHELAVSLAPVVQPVIITRTGTVETTSTYALFGDFTLTDNDGELSLSLASNYNASTALPGLYVYLSNNPNSSADAYEIGAVTVFNGEHSYNLPNTLGIYDYQYLLYFCKPFNVKVGVGTIN